VKQVLEPICEGLDRFEAFEDLVLGLAVVGRSELGLAAEDAWSRAALRLPDSPHQNSGRRPAPDRARALDLLRQGRSNNEVARLTGRAPNTVRAWRAKYLREVA
jgi:DNA-binding NarL/FixJ family response regulator